MPNFTRKAIKASFIKLLSEQPLNKISVRNIVEDCGINRNSFYYHFQDIPSLIEEIITETADGLIAEYPRIESLEDCVADAFRFMTDNKRAILHIFNSISRDIFERYLMRCCEYTVQTYLETVFTENRLEERDHNLLIRFFKYELFGAALEWLSQGMPQEALEDIQRCLVFCKGLSEDIIRRGGRMEK